MISRDPCPALRSSVSKVWTSDAPSGRPGRERVLPTGSMHLVLRLEGPLRLFDREDDPEGRVIGLAIVGGARATAYLRDTSGPVRSVGAQLRPGASAALLGVPALALAERHTPLDEVWGAAVWEMHERLGQENDPARRLALFEAMLVARQPAAPAFSPVVASALRRLEAGVPVGVIVEDTGYSHRGFSALFEREVGLTPKRFQRVRRMQRALADAVRGEGWARIAATHGYADQSHLHRDLRELGGVTPAAYVRAAPRDVSHVPVSGGEHRRLREREGHGPSHVALPIRSRPTAPREPRWGMTEDER